MEAQQVANQTGVICKVCGHRRIEHLQTLGGQARECAICDCEQFDGEWFKHANAGK